MSECLSKAPSSMSRCPEEGLELIFVTKLSACNFLVFSRTRAAQSAPYMGARPQPSCQGGRPPKAPGSKRTWHRPHRPHAAFRVVNCGTVGLGSEAPAQVEFEDDAEDVEEVEIDKTPKRKVHGRQPTAFVPKAKASSGARALLATAEDTHINKQFQLEGFACHLLRCDALS